MVIIMPPQAKSIPAVRVVAIFVRLLCQSSMGAIVRFIFVFYAALFYGQGFLCLKKAKKFMGENHGPDFLLYSLIELRPSEAKRRFRKSIFEDYPLRGPFGHCACAYCGSWNEKLTLDHIVPKSSGGPHFAKYNLAPSCFSCNSSKGSQPIFEWWRPKEFWTEQREKTLLAWIHSHSFVSAHTELKEQEQWMENTQRILPVHERPKEKAVSWPPLLCLPMAS